jgi:uncharacterized integral membrane protein
MTEAGARAGFVEPSVGRTRDPVVVLFFSIVTLGIYQLYWYYRSFKEARTYSGEGVGGGLGVVLAFLCGIVAVFVLSSEVGRLYERTGGPRRVSAAHGLWVLLPIIGWAIWLWTVQNALNDFWRGQVDPAFAPEPDRASALLAMIGLAAVPVVVIIAVLNWQSAEVEFLPGATVDVPLALLMVVVVVTGAVIGWFVRANQTAG